MRICTYAISIFCLLLTACGGDLPDGPTARTLWGTLAASYVARPFVLEELTTSGAGVNPHCPGGGEVRGELWHTAYQTGAEGEASGTARYQLVGCRALQQELALHGEIRRGFKVRREMQLPPGASDPQMGLERRDTFWGELEMRDGAHGTCTVDVTRVFASGASTFSGTLCGHEVTTLGLGERPTP